MPGITHVSLVRELGQPSLTIEPDRAKIARYGLNVADINALIETAVGGTPATQVIQGERSFDLVVRLQEPYRQNMEAIKNILIATPDNQHLPLSQFADIKVSKGASFIYRESQLALRRHPVQRRGARPGERRRRTRRRRSQRRCTCRSGYTFDWGGEYQQYLAARSQMAVILPLTVVLIVLILFALYGNLKFPLIIMFSVLVTVPVGGLLALKLTGTNFSVSSGLRLRRADGRRRADERHPVLVHQQAASRREGHHDRDARGVAAPAAPDHDDGAGRLHRPAAGRDVDRHRQRLAEAVRHRHRRRPGVAAGAVDLSGAGAVRAGRARTTMSSRYDLAAHAMPELRD